MTLLEKLLRIENFFWAWEKAKASYSFDKTWYDEIELARFEAQLKRNLIEIQSAFESGAYVLHPARAIAFPKRGDTPDSAKTRQMFWFSVRDQVAWIALVNVIGPLVDRLMPSWSYGDRLYRSVWRSASNPLTPALTERARLRIGPYRHTSKHLYRPFKYAWPRYRRHLYLTVNVMARPVQSDSLSAEDVMFLEDEQQLQNDRVKVPYLQRGFWSERHERIHWAGLDLTKFFPSTPVHLIERRLIEAVSEADPEYHGELNGLIRSMLVFPLDLRGWTGSEVSDEFTIAAHEREIFQHLPTGLLVAGFLANASLLNVDREVVKQLKLDHLLNERHNLAHFRYVDDHVILSPDVDALLGWVQAYKQILHTENDEWNVNRDKVEPQPVRDYLNCDAADEGKRSDLRNKLKTQPLDPEFPRPLLSHTLTKISLIASTRFELLDDDSQLQFIQDLELLLLGDFGHSEVRPDTRASFAASVLAKSAPHFRQMTSEAWRAKDDKQRCHNRLASLAAEKARYAEGQVPDSALVEESQLQKALPGLVLAETRASMELERSRLRDRKRTFRLLMNAIGRYPDKIRLWQTAVKYCARGGHNGLAELVKVASEQTLLHPLTRSYVAAVLAQSTSIELLNAVRKLMDGGAAPEEHEAAAEFIASVSLEDFEQIRKSKWYGDRAWSLLLAAAWAASICLRDTMALDLFDAATFIDPARQNVDHLRSRRDVNMAAVLRHASRADPDHTSAGDVGLWLDNALGSRAGAAGAIWHAVREHLAVDDSSAATLLARYPRSVSIADVRSMAVGTLSPYSVNPGWYYDAFRYRRTTQRRELLRLAALVRRRRTRIAGIVRNALDAGMTSKRFLPLDDWIEWVERYGGTGALALERAADPRLGEWTALQIVDGVVAELEKMTISRRPPIHPANIMIPVAWTRAAGAAPGGVSWTEWKHLMLSRGIRFAGTQWIDDERYMGPEWNADRTSPPDWPWIRGCGLLLLGMLRRSFDWPPSWNSDFAQNARSNLSRALISMLPCSSTTTAILESTLTPRSRENVIRQADLLAEQLEADTMFDPPKIDSLQELRAWLRRSSETLEAHQMSGHQNKPRQLVPLRLKQLTRPEWAIVEAADDGE